MKSERAEAVEEAYRQINRREDRVWTWEEIRALIGE